MHHNTFGDPGLRPDPLVELVRFPRLPNRNGEPVSKGGRDEGMRRENGKGGELPKVKMSRINTAAA